MRTHPAAAVLAAAALVFGGVLTPPAAVAATPAAAVDSDQPCTRRPPLGVPLQDVGYRPDDLARMVVPQAGLGQNARSYSVDWTRYGYMDNTEFAQIEVAPSGVCSFTQTYGRILGFSGSYEEAAAPWRYVTSSVHLFFSAGDAAAWLRAFVAALRQQVGTRGLRSVSVTPLPALGAGAVRLQVVAADGVRSWVLFPRQAVVGSVLHFRPANTASRFDVTSLASVLRERIDTMRSRVAARVEKLDAPLLLSLPLRRTALGSRYAGLTWDWFFGGCTDTVELASRRPPTYNIAADATAFGRQVGCSGLFSAPNGQRFVNGVSHVRTSAGLYATADGARRALAETVADDQRMAGRTYNGDTYGPVTRFTTPRLGEETIGLQQRVGDRMSTQILFRRGRLLLSAWFETKGASNLGNEIRRIATDFDTRVVTLLARNVE